MVNQPVFPSPNAAAMGVFAQFPAGSFTGVPPITVPLYDMTFNDISLPVRLAYNTNLVKPDNNSSWVGFGWNLTAGGMITRVVNDKPDDQNYDDDRKYISSNVTDVGYYYHHYLSSSDWTTKERIEGAALDMQHLVKKDDRWKRFTTIRDYSPDEFSFSVGNFSGTFYLDPYGKWQVRSQENVKIEISGSDFDSRRVTLIDGTSLPNKKYLKRITLTSAEGIKYVFGGSPEYLEFAYTYQVNWGGLVSARSCVKTWYLAQIISPNGKKIEFNYQKGPDFHHHILLYEQWYDTQAPDAGINYSTEIIEASYLKSIETEAHIIDFTTSNKTTELLKLDEVKIVSKVTNKITKRIYFTYEEGDSKYFKLMAVEDKGANNEDLGIKYQFHYNTLRFPAGDLSEHRDHWGYFTSRKLNPSTYSTFVNSLQADTAYCRAELLSKIVYPTGGSTEYLWEPNDYSKTVSKDRSALSNDPTQYAGGVRVKRIVNYDNKNKVVGSKTYQYTLENGMSSGILYGNPSYKYIRHDLFFFGSTLPLTDNNTGSHISYSEVKEINNDESYSITQFSNFDTGIGGEYMDNPRLTSFNNYSNPIRQIWNDYASNSHERGFPLRERAYSKAGALVKEKTIKYQRFNKAAENVRTYIMMVEPWEGGDSWEGSATRIYTNAFLPEKEIEVVYNVNGEDPITTVKTYSYTTERLLRYVRVFDSREQAISVSYRYPADVLSDEVPGSVYSKMVSGHMLKPIEVITSKEISGESFVLDAALNTYVVNNDESQIVLSGQYGLDVNTPIRMSEFTPFQIQTFSEMRDHRMHLKSSYSYDENSNLVAETREGKHNTSYLWGYNKTLPIAKIDNAYFYSSPGEQWYGIFFFVDLMNRGQRYPILGTCSFPKTVTTTITRKYEKGDDHESTFTVYIYDAAHNLVTTYTDFVSYEKTSLSVASEITLPAGTYSVEVSSDGLSQTPYVEEVTVRMDGLFKNPTSLPFYTSFEEDQTGTDEACFKTGRKSHFGSYSIALPPYTSPDNKFILSYWSKQNTDSPWKLVKQSIVIPREFSSITIGSANQYIDEVRIYPEDGAMTTFTYDPLIGVTSRTDANDETTYYEYDAFQRLMIIKDHNGRIIKQYCYNYTGQQTPCFSITGKATDSNRSATIFVPQANAVYQTPSRNPNP
ncbi:hypothetical protein DDR33_24190 [Pararcticibacter amylolyticus]|uniref:Sugar-binding protein n=1 Tax=Pararcticibacter amylolyticus TaxID=2173175 RepID=A0A2U2P9Q4_9SPHI|nr:hypothetical protein DDR33_24190 [Pararcticibacter amylolyticus]